MTPDADTGQVNRTNSPIMTNTLDKTLQALSHPTRREMLERLTQGSLRVTELSGPYSGEVSLNAISKHIKVLEGAGLVRRAREGRDHRISLEPEPFREVADLVRFYSGFWMRRLEQLDQLLKTDEKPAT